MLPDPVRPSVAYNLNGGPLLGLWTVSGFSGFYFNLVSSQVVARTATSFHVTGVGVINDASNAYSPTFATWLFDVTSFGNPIAPDAPTAGRFNFTGGVAVVPAPDTNTSTYYLLAYACAGLVLAKRVRRTRSFDS